METKSANEDLHIGRYANVLMDRWFKRSFGTEENKRLLELLLHELIPDRLQFLFLELPNCKSALTPKATLLGNFCYALRNLPHLDEQPAEFSQEIFTLLFNSAEIATFSVDERNKYKHDMTTQRDIRNQIAYARKEGVAQGIEQGIAEGEARGEARGRAEERLEVAKNLIKLGMTSEQICQATGLTQEQVQAL